MTTNPKEKRNLPALTDLYEAGKTLQLQKENDLTVLLNQAPAPAWVRDHPTAKDVKYIPIGIIEWLLTYLFVNWHVEIRETKLIANSVAITIRLFFRDPVTGEERWTDGVGAAPLQVNKGELASDFDKIKAASVMIAAPMAKTYAIKDAAETLGKLFGKDLNRKEDMGYDQFLGRFEKKDELQVIKQRIKEALDHYQGADCEEIRKECQAATTLKIFDLDFAMKIADKIGLTKITELSYTPCPREPPNGTKPDSVNSRPPNLEI
jgi:hypothetical protein